MLNDDFVLEKCPRCGHETPVEPLGNEEGVLETVVCAQCGNVFIQTPIGPPGSKPSLMPTDDRRQERKQGARAKIKKWWQDHKKS
jgi:hypothetical protein